MVHFCIETITFKINVAFTCILHIVYIPFMKKHNVQATVLCSTIAFWYLGSHVCLLSVCSLKVVSLLQLGRLEAPQIHPAFTVTTVGPSTPTRSPATPCPPTPPALAVRSLREDTGEETTRAPVSQNAVSSSVSQDFDQV